MKKEAAPDANFEASFADLAYTYIRDKVPKLLDFVTGFQVESKNDDETRAAGVFGFDVNGQTMYVPVFYMSGELKGYDMLFLKDQDIFVPAQENWVNYVVNNKSPQLGGPSPYDTADIPLSYPDFSQYSRSPLSLSKSAGMVTGSYVRGEAFDLAPFLRSLFVGPGHPVFEKQASELTLPAFLKDAGVKAAADLVRAAKESPEFSAALFRFYSPADLMVNLAKQAAARPDNVDTNKDGCLAIVQADNANVDLTDDEVRDVISDGFAVRDTRNKTSTAYATDTGLSIGGVDRMGPGVVRVVDAAGQLRDALVCESPLTIGDGSVTGVQIVAMEGDPVGMLAGTGEVLTDRPEGSAAAFKRKFDGFSPVSSIKASDAVSYADRFSAPRYIIIDEKGVMTLPFQVVRKETKDGVTTLLVDDFSCFACGNGCVRPSSYGNSRWDQGPRVTHSSESMAISLGRGGAEHPPCTAQVRKVVVSNAATRMRNTGDTLVVPSSCRVIKTDGGACFPFALGSISSLQAASFGMAKTASIRVVKSGDSYQMQINKVISPPLTKFAAFDTLASGLGLHADSARRILSSTTPGKAASYLVKVAEGYYGPPSVEDPQKYFDPAMRADVQPQQSDYMPIQGLQGSDYQQPARGDIDLNNPYARRSPDMSAAMLAAKTGDKSVFDVATIGSLINSTGTPDLIDRYTGRLITGMDHVGRLLFLFYWKNDVYKERYGQEEMQELEDSLRDTFKGLGNLILFLKKKGSEPSIMSQGSDVDLSRA